MGDPRAVQEGCLKYRDKKKWKSRWAVISKLSPVADCLHLQLYRDSKERCKNGPTKASLSLESFLGMETGFTLDKESNTMALICSEVVVILAFDTRESLMQWTVKMKANLPEAQQFLIQIAHAPAKSKLTSGPARLHLQNYNFSIVSCIPPRVLGIWPMKELRRFGVVGGKLCFEGGSLCGRGEGLHVLLTNQAEEIVKAMDFASKGQLVGKRKKFLNKNSAVGTCLHSMLCKSKSPQHALKRNSANDCSLIGSSDMRPNVCALCSEVSSTSGSYSEDMTYNMASSVNFSPCSVQYRWPSCMSRWGHGSSTTISDAESLDAISMTLSDYQGPAHAGTSSKPSSFCLNEGQHVWPFDYCWKCSLPVEGKSNPMSLQGNSLPSPNLIGEFSPHWKMNAALPSPTTEEKSDLRKESAYQLMMPSVDQASLCSHNSNCSTTSSSSSSECSVTRENQDTLYDKPRSILSSGSGSMSRVMASHVNPSVTCCSSPKRIEVSKSQHESYCSCQDSVFQSWIRETPHKLECPCFNQLLLPGQDKMPCNTLTGNNTLLFWQKNSQTIPCLCKKTPTSPCMNHTVPKATNAHVLQQNKKYLLENEQNADVSRRLVPSEDYDVPRKFMDIPATCDHVYKSSGSRTTQAHAYGGTVLCSKSNSLTCENVQICACQRLAHWARSFVPCLAGSALSSTEYGWQNGRGAKCLNSNITAVPNQYGTICREPLRTSEMLSGQKVKYTVQMNAKPPYSQLAPTSVYDKPSIIISERENSEIFSDNCSLVKNSMGSASNSSTGAEKTTNATDSSLMQDYANLDFSQPLSLYENIYPIQNGFDQTKTMVYNSGEQPVVSGGQIKCHNKSHSLSTGNSVTKQAAYDQKPLTKCDDYNSYELMQPNNQNSLAAAEEESNYLMMEPVQKTKLPVQLNSSSALAHPQSYSQAKTFQNVTDLPLRPFLPFYHCQLDLDKDTSPRLLLNKAIDVESVQSVSSQLNEKEVSENPCMLMNKNEVINEIPDSVSPSCSNKSVIQSQDLMLRKLGLKEKYLNHSEIIRFEVLLSSLGLNNIYQRDIVHRSVDCLEFEKDCDVSFENDFSSDKNMLSQEDTLLMKRSSSEPLFCLYNTYASNVPIVLMKNDFNDASSKHFAVRREIKRHKLFIQRFGSGVTTVEIKAACQ